MSKYGWKEPLTLGLRILTLKLLPEESDTSYSIDTIEENVEKLRGSLKIRLFKDVMQTSLK